MNKLDLAASLIRPSIASKLTDRAWLVPVLFALLAWVAAFLGRVSFDATMNLTMVLIGGAAVGEKVKDAVIGSSAVRGEAPQSVAVNNVDNGPARAGDVLKNAGAQIIGDEIERATGVDLSQFIPRGFASVGSDDDPRDDNDDDLTEIQAEALMAQEREVKSNG